MSLQISCFAGRLAIDPSGNGRVAQVVKGAPTANNGNAATTGAYAIPAGTTLIKIKGTGTITWPGGLIEEFDGTEFRGVAGGEAITVA